MDSLKSSLLRTPSASIILVKYCGHMLTWKYILNWRHINITNWLIGNMLLSNNRYSLCVSLSISLFLSLSLCFYLSLSLSLLCLSPPPSFVWAGGFRNKRRSVSVSQTLSLSLSGYLLVTARKLLQKVSPQFSLFKNKQKPLVPKQCWYTPAGLP